MPRPDASLRDGVRARELVTLVSQSDSSTSVGETMAMALAESGDYAEAALVQREVLESARAAGLHASIARMQSNLREYERRRPCRIPWRHDEPLYLPAVAPR